MAPIRIPSHHQLKKNGSYPARFPTTDAAIQKIGPRGNLSLLPPCLQSFKGLIFLLPIIGDDADGKTRYDWSGLDDEVSTIVLDGDVWGTCIAVK